MIHSKAVASERTGTAATAADDARKRTTLIALLGASILSACSSLPGMRPQSDSTDAAIEVYPGRVSDALAQEAAFLALSLVDTPYRHGGNTPRSGFDCSGLIVYVFRAAADFALPRTVAQIARTGAAVRFAEVRIGDLVLFDTSGRYSHAGIYISDGRFVHAPSSGGTVRLDNVAAHYWKPRFSGVRRL